MFPSSSRTAQSRRNHSSLLPLASNGGDDKYRAKKRAPCLKRRTWKVWLLFGVIVLLLYVGYTREPGESPLRSATRRLAGGQPTTGQSSFVQSVKSLALVRAIPEPPEINRLRVVNVAPWYRNPILNVRAPKLSPSPQPEQLPPPPPPPPAAIPPSPPKPANPESPDSEDHDTSADEKAGRPPVVVVDEKDQPPVSDEKDQLPVFNAQGDDGGEKKEAN
jgi:hypothetical protein